MPQTPIHTELEASAAFGTPNLQPWRPEEGGVPYLIHRTDQTLVRVEEMLRAPTRTRHKLDASDLASFIAATKMFSGADSIIYANREKLALRCVVDHYTRDKTAWGQHLISYEMKHSPDWLTWTGANKRRFEQAEFAEWLDDNALVIVEPKPAAIIELARNLEVRQSGVFKQATRIQDGSYDLTYTVNNEAQNVKVPERIRIELPVCSGDKTNVQLEARFRWRISDGRTMFFYDLYRVDDVLDRYWENVSAEIAADTGLKVLQGRY